VFNSLEVIYNKPAETFMKSYEYFMNQRNKEKMLRMEEAEEDEGITQEAANHAAPAPQPDDDKKDSSVMGDADLLGGDGNESIVQARGAGSSGHETMGDEDQGTF
jgi:hypothetical protein